MSGDVAEKFWDSWPRTLDKVIERRVGHKGVGFGADVTAPVVVSSSPVEGSDDTDFDNVSGRAVLDYAFTDRLSVQAGIRYTEESKDPSTVPRAIVLALTADASMWMAVFADMGASLLVVFNGLRLLRSAHPRCVATAARWRASIRSASLDWP